MENFPVITPYAIALYTFKGESADELSFEANDIILLTNHIDDNWLEGEIDGKPGIFPANHVAIQVDCITPASAANAQATVSTYSKRYLEISKSFPTNPFLTERVDNENGLNRSRHSNTHSSDTWSASFDEVFKPGSARATTDPWFSASFDSEPSPSKSLTGFSTKRTVLKQNSVTASFPVEENQRKCGRKPFILKNKPAPSVPWTKSFSFPSNDPWEVPGNSVGLSPKPRTTSSIKSISGSEKGPSRKEDAERLFGEFGYAATKLFRAKSDNENVQNSTKVAATGTIKQTSDPTTVNAELATYTNNAMVFNMKANTFRDQLKGTIMKAPKPLPRQRNSDSTVAVNRETKKQIPNGLAPVPAPRRSIQNVKESGNIADHQTSVDKNEKLTNVFKHTNESDMNISELYRLRYGADKVRLNGNTGNFGLEPKPVADVRAQSNTEIGDNLYSEITTEVDEEYYAVIEQNSGANVYTAMPTLDSKTESAEKFQTGITNIKIPLPPMSIRSKLAQRCTSLNTSWLKNSGASESLQSKIQTIDRMSVKIPASVETENSEDVISANNCESQSDLNQATCTNYMYNSTEGNVTNKEENIYEVMWPVQQKLTTETSIPPPLPPKRNVQSTLNYGALNHSRFVKNTKS